MRLRLDTAFLRDEGWQEFVDAGARLPSIAHGGKANDRQVRDQASQRAPLPQHHSIAAVEHVLRSFTFRNQRRMNLLLGLMRLAELRVDDLDHYTELLREAACAAAGRISYQRQGYCTGAAYDLRPRGSRGRAHRPTPLTYADVVAFALMAARPKQMLSPATTSW
jgi:hypothetical protein